MAERDSRMPGPLLLDANAAENWRKFFMQFDIYVVAKGKDDKADKMKVNMLLHCAGPEAIEEWTEKTVDLRDSLIRDRIVGGVFSHELRGELLKKPDLTLQTADDYCRTFEAA